ncbi:helix-turn-helix domain-containing protein [Streptomyces sp. NPDC093252]|uniref:AraC-like ligand-binding domain-containing protein n=1 Tax=Streptomyces sp. NPDC093252 TaxID=3154980 RepID=UPI003426AFBE
MSRLVTEFSTDAVDPRERRAQFQEVAGQWHVPNQFRSDQEESFSARMRALDLGSLQISALTFPHLEVARTARLVRQHDPEVLYALLMTRGEGGVSSGKHDTRIRAGELVLVDSSVPFQGVFADAAQVHKPLVVQVPRSLIPLSTQVVRRTLATAIPVDQGMGGTLTRWLGDVMARGDEFAPADTPALAEVTVSLLSSVLSQVTDTCDSLSPHAAQAALRTAVYEFTARHIGDPLLTPRTVADAHHISLRSLHRLFSADGIGIAEWIRRQRLERCRVDLANPYLWNETIRDIARRWGFTDQAHFSRLFRVTYGLPPRDYRRCALAPGTRRSARTGRE